VPHDPDVTRAEALLAGVERGHYRLPEAIIAAAHARRLVVAALSERLTALGTASVHNAAITIADRLLEDPPDAIGTDVLLAIRAELVAVNDEREGLELETAALRAAADRSGGRLVRAISDEEGIVECLRAALTETLDRARDAAGAFRGGPVPGPEAVRHMPRVKADAWTSLSEASDRYSAIRGASRQLLGGAYRSGAEAVLSEFRDPLDERLWSTWERWSQRRILPPPWPQPALDRMAWLTTLPAGLVWLPTSAELDEALAAVSRPLERREAVLGVHVPPLPLSG
jgi:hypothetical protein